MLLPSALGFSPHPPVSVYGTGMCNTIAAFLGSPSKCFATKFRSLHTPESYSGFANCLPRCFDRFFHSRLTLSFCVPTVLSSSGTGISTCCPSTTSFDLALGPDLPRADQLYPGILRYSAERILTFLSLLIPAFSLLNTPRILPVALLRVNNAPLPMYYYIPKLRCRVSAPDIFGAGPLD